MNPRMTTLFAHQKNSEEKTISLGWSSAEFADALRSKSRLITEIVKELRFFVYMKEYSRCKDGSA